jgi:hypothetical protein
MDNIVIDSSDSDSDYEDSSDGHSDREEVVYESENFLNHVKKNEYKINRNKLFTPDIEEIDIMVESHISGVNNYTYPLYSDNGATGGHGEYKNVIGINLISACVSQTNSSLNHFVNICVENIPYNACIHNKNGEHILGRMCMTKGSGLLNEFEPDNIKLNYFYPITLHEIKIKLMCKYTDGTDWADYDSDRHNSFVFRLTLLKNLNLLK